MQSENEEFKTLLKNKGLKITNQRLAVLEVLQERNNQHFTAEEIFDLVRELHPDIGLATVYRTIQLLSDMKIIDKLTLDDGFVRYEFRREAAGGHRHHHLLCLKCGGVFSFEKDFLSSLEGEIEKMTDFKVVDHEIKFFGYCKNCRDDTKKD